MSLADRFHLLFIGLEYGHGEYTIPPGTKPDEKGKIMGKALTVLNGATPELWARHLQGTSSFGLGVVPIREDTSCMWGAIDVDIYPVDTKRLAADVKRYGLPLAMCHTKSAGAHLYVFLKTSVPAELVRAVLMEWAILLGYPDVEVFPKQTKLASRNDQGNWINMPYQAGERTVRYCEREGAGLNPEEFLDYAASLALTPEELKTFKPLEADPFEEVLKGAPPCLMALARRGIPAGGRNNALFNFAVYLKKRYGDEWSGHLEEFNRRFMSPPLPHQEIAGTIKSVNKKMYNFKCKEPPIVSVCNRTICLTRAFGVGTEAGSDDPGVAFGELVKLETDPPTYLWDVNGARLEVGAEDLMDQRRFHKLCLQELQIWPNFIKPSLWRDIIQERLDRIEIIKPPRDATPAGQFFIHLDIFLHGRAQARTIDEMTMGRPFHDTDKQRMCFRAVDLFNYLQMRKFKFNEREVYIWLREMKMDNAFAQIKGRGINYWYLPETERQTEPFDVPRAQQPGDF